MEPSIDIKSAVVRVGGGRGFIIEAFHRRLVVTAGHCLPSFPPCHGASYTHERTYPELLGTLDNPTPTVWAECLYIDPIADIAILGTPDEQDLYDEAEAYEELTETLPAIQISPVTIESDAWILTLDGRWVRCVVKPPAQDYCMGTLCITNSEEPIQSGMSGSPILDNNSGAIGVVCISDAGTPRLTHALPGWLLQSVTY